MRGKRTLAGVAVAGLTAALIPFLGAAPAQAAAATNFVFDNTGLTAIAGAQTGDFPVVISTVDALGEAPTTISGNTGSGSATQVMSAALTAWPGSSEGVAYGVVTAPIGIATSASGTGAGSESISSLSINSSGQSVIYITRPTGASNWTTTTTGSYNIAVTITTTATGATITKNFPVTVLARNTTPAGSVAWVQGNNRYATVNALSGQVGIAANGTVGYARLFDSAGRALLVSSDDTTTAAPAVQTLTASLARTTSTGTTATVAGVVASNVNAGVYSVTPNSGLWEAGSNALIASYNTPTTATTSRLTVNLASANGTATSTTLSTTPSLEMTSAQLTAFNTANSTAALNGYYVPAGTSALAFSSTTTDTSGTVAWSASTSAALGQITSSAGIAAISQVGALYQYNTSMSVNAAASAKDKFVYYSSGYNTAAYPVAVVFQSPAPTLTAPETLVAKVGTEVTVSGTVTDQWERPLGASSIVTLTGPTGALIGSTVPGADGAFSFKIPAALAPATADDVTYSLTATSGTSTASASTTIDYTATGEITSLVISSQPVAVSGQIPAVQTPGTGALVLSNVSASLVNPSAPGTTVPSGQVVYMTFDATPTTNIQVSGSDGVYFSTANTGTVNWNGGVTSANVVDGATLTVWTTKAGKSTITATAGGKTTTQDIFAFVPSTTARNVALSPAKTTVGTSTFTQLTLDVTDVFGNPVPGVTVGTASSNQVVVSLAGGGSLPTATTWGTTSAAGKLVFSYTSGTATGSAEVSALGVAGLTTQFDTTIVDAPASKFTAKSEITVSGAGGKSIVIAGERGTVSGKNGVIFEGTTTGFENGATVKPWIRFPGETQYAVGSARPTINAIGEFSWQRKTGKKIYVYFTNEAGDVKSNRVIVDAA